jgi:hypothetical protein
MGQGLTNKPHGPNGKESVNVPSMRTRTLVLTSESARHPFRQRLPRHVLRIDAPAARPAGEQPSDGASDDKDWKLFMLSFGAFFTAFYSFIF